MFVWSGYGVWLRFEYENEYSLKGQCIEENDEKSCFNSGWQTKDDHVMIGQTHSHGRLYR